MTAFLTSLFFRYVGLSFAFSMLGIPLGLMKRKMGPDCLKYALEFGFFGAWAAIGSAIGRTVETLIDLLDGDKDGDSSWKDAPQGARPAAGQASPVRVTAGEDRHPARRAA